jgi:uncharacterized protein (DUF58 family)
MRVKLPETGGLPTDLPFRRQDRLILIGDFILPIPEFEAQIRQLAARGGHGTLVMVRDPAEEIFPFAGEVEFEGLEGPEIWRVGEAGDVALAYRERIAAHGEELRRIAMRHGFTFLRHVTDRPPAELILMLAALISGQQPVASAPRGTGSREEAS